MIDTVSQSLLQLAHTLNFSLSLFHFLHMQQYFPLSPSPFYLHNLYLWILVHLSYLHFAFQKYLYCCEACDVNQSPSCPHPQWLSQVYPIDLFCTLPYGDDLIVWIPFYFSGLKIFFQTIQIGINLSDELESFCLLSVPTAFTLPLIFLV